MNTDSEIDGYNYKSYKNALTIYVLVPTICRKHYTILIFLEGLDLEDTKVMIRTYFFCK